MSPSLSGRYLSMRLRRLLSIIRHTFRKRKGTPVHQERWGAGRTFESRQPSSPGHFDAHGDRYSTLSDLCYHMGNQLPLPVVKLLARDILRELTYLHEACDCIHSDIRPETILISPEHMKMLITEYRRDDRSWSPSQLSASSNFLDCNAHLTSTDPSSIVFRLSRVQQKNEYLSIPIHSLRAPESILRAPSSKKIDLWNLGCVLHEVLTGESLFDPFFQTVELGLSCEESHLIQMIELFGQFPQDLLRDGQDTGVWFDEIGAFRIQTTYYPVSLEGILEAKISDTDVADAASFLRTMLQLRPEDRWSAKDLIDHLWFS